MPLTLVPHRKVRNGAAEASISVVASSHGTETSDVSAELRMETRTD